LEDVEPTVTLHPIKNPHMRMQLKGALESLADQRHQSEVWLAPAEVERADSFTLCVNMLFDDLLLDERDDEDVVGDLLVDAAEAARVRAVVRLIDRLLDELGPDASDAEFMRHAQWLSVVNAAADALDLMRRNEE
jgi:hypothetical protein